MVGRLAAMSSERVQVTSRDAALAAVLERSFMVRAARSVLDRVETAWPQSRVASALSRLAQTWSSTGGPVRLRMSGVMVLTAALVHLALASWQAPDDWRWLVVPVVAAGQGAVLIMMSKSRV
jgi:hypothetical protein